MSDWFFNSKGQAVAFRSGRHVYWRTSRYLGELELSGEVWYGRYVGEIFDRDRLLYRINNGYGAVGMRGVPGTPGIPPIAGSPGSIAMPSGYSDLDIE